MAENKAAGFGSGLPPATWLITGANGGLGRALAEVVLGRGDAAVLTARRPETLADFAERYPATAVLAPLDLSHPENLTGLIETTVQRFGSLDVLVNNAGQALLGAIEEGVAEEYRALFEVNLFGPIELVRAALPALRRSRRGRIVNISSVGGFVATAGFGYYNATKFALEGLSDALAQEVTPHGIRVILVQPGAFRTNMLASLAVSRCQLPEYDATVGPSRRYRTEGAGNQPGDPARGAALVLEAVDSDDPPHRLPLGADACARIAGKLVAITRELDLWRERASATAFSDAPPQPQWVAQ